MHASVITDKPPYFKETRFGHWRHVYDYETGQGRWHWDGPRLTPEQLESQQRRVDGQARRWGIRP